MKLLVTGGAGFIGSHFIRLMMKRRDVTLLINLDKLTYAANLENLREFTGDRRYRFVRGDIASPLLVAAADERCRPRRQFRRRNARRPVDPRCRAFPSYQRDRRPGSSRSGQRRRSVKRFLHISTDEVYGSLARGLRHGEIDALDPRSPYSASKAAADHLVMAYHHTYGLPVLITRAGNNYGPLPVSGEISAAFYHPCDDRSAASSLRRRDERPRVAPCGGSLPGD